MEIAHRKKKTDETVAEQFPLYNLRNVPRWEVHNRAYYRIKDVPVVVRTEIKDLSPNGVCLYVSSDVRIGQKLKLKICLSEKENCEADGAVIWKRHVSGHRYHAGVRFDQLPQEKQDRVLEYVLGQSESPQEP